MTTAQADPNTPPADGKCHFSRLPRELRENIFRLAYTNTNPVKILTRTQAKKRINRLKPSVKDRFYWKVQAAHRFDTTGPCAFLVNKAWLAEAYPIYLSNNSFELEDTYEVHHFLAETHPLPIKDHITSLIFAYIHLVPGRYSFSPPPPNPIAPVLNRSPKLRSVAVQYDYTYDWCMFSWRAGMPGLEWYVCPRKHRRVLEDLKALRGLEHFELVPWVDVPSHAVEVVVGKIKEAEAGIRKVAIGVKE